MVTYDVAELGKVCEVTPGPSGALLDRLHEGPDGVPVIAPPDITVRHAIDLRRVRRMPLSQVGKLARFELDEGDILLVRQGALGRFALVPPHEDIWVYGSACVRVRPRGERLLPAYLAAFLGYEETQHTVLGMAQGGTVPSLNTAQIQKLLIVLPPLAQQQAIVETVADIEATMDGYRVIVDRLGLLGQAVLRDMIEGREQT